MRLLWKLLTIFRRPKCTLFLLVLGLLGAGTFYWELWELSWLPLFGESSSLVGDAFDVSAEQEPQGPLRPAPLNCISQPVRVVPNDRYCSWDTSLQDCYDKLQPVLEKQPSWVFLGDDGMANIPYYISMKWSDGNLNITTRRNPCQNLMYYHLPPPADGWKQPNPSLGEGPVGRGKDRPYCMDYNSWNVKMQGDTDPTKYVEFLNVEYARDVSIPSLITKTTQETAIYYLSKEPPAVCVASAGFNDAAIQPPLGQGVLVENVDKYLALLQRTCHYVVWIGLHAAVERTSIPQRNCQLRNWNHAILAAIQERNYENVYIMDIWDKTLFSDFHSPTRLGKKYYASLARLFRSLMNGAEQSNYFQSN